MDRPLPPARKRFGQNFLHDPSVLSRIVDSLDLSSDSRLLEIGPGRGALTRRLLERADQVVAVEIDRDLARHLRETFPSERLTVIEQDVLELDLATLAGGSEGPKPWTIAGNLPYNISKPIAMRLVESVAVVERAALMFQREVAERLTANPGGPDYGPLGILPRAVYDIRRVMDVAPGAFRPRPGVVSSVTLWTARADRIDDRRVARLRTVLGACFANRRKTLKNNVRRALGSAEVLEQAGLDGSLRPQDLAPGDFRSLADVWPESA